MIDLGPAAPPARVCEPLGPEWDDPAAALLAPCTAEHSTTAARALLASLRADPDATPYVLIDGGAPVALYALRKRGLAREIPFLIVAPAHRRRGFGRACLHDALRRAATHPLVAETDDAALPFYRAVGFKLVGTRRAADGSPRYRLGWHAPRPAPQAPPTPIDPAPAN